jgi:hypothetical protein
MTLPQTLAMLLLLALGSLSTAQAQSQPASACHAPDVGSEHLVRRAIVYTTDSTVHGEEARRHLQLPRLTAEAVRYVQDSNTCSRVKVSYDAATGMHNSVTGKDIEPSAQLYVVAVGDFFVAFDPVKTAGEYALIGILDRDFRVLATVLN